MDSFEFNKYAMAILGTVFLVMCLTFVSEGLFHSEKPEQQGYAVEVAEKFCIFRGKFRTSRSCL